MVNHNKCSETVQKPESYDENVRELVIPITNPRILELVRWVIYGSDLLRCTNGRSEKTPSKTTQCRHIKMRFSIRVYTKKSSQLTVQKWSVGDFKIVNSVPLSTLRCRFPASSDLKGLKWLIHYCGRPCEIIVKSRSCVVVTCSYLR